MGPNGCGKSTLLSIISGEKEMTSGSVSLESGRSLGYLEQYQTADESYSNIHDYVLSVRSDILDMEEQLVRLEDDMRSPGALSSVMEEYHTISHKYELADGASYRSRVVGVLKGLGFEESDFDKSMARLSGGQKTRVNLARLLLMDPDVMLLDEPVNHLDLKSIEWLEGFLSSYKRAVIVVAHDRYFLDRIATDVLDLGSDRNMLYHGNYTAFVREKAERKKAYEKAYSKQQKEIKHQEEVITRLKQFNREKSIRRAESRQKKLDSMELMDAPEKERDQMRISLPCDRQSGKDVLNISGLGKSFQDHRVFSDISFLVQRGQRVALIGENGCGKTTILKIINEIIPPDEGSVKLGAGVEVAYYDQEQQNLNEEKTLFEELSDTYSGLSTTRIRNVLAAFLFKEDDAFKKISDLSGGERGRISLCKLMLLGANFLILDEPTNHLDMESKEILANALLAYSGTLLYVSHDRYFINQTADRILELSTEHGIREFLGDYDYYQTKRNELDKKSESAKASDNKNTSSKEEWIRQKEAKTLEKKRENQRIKIEEEIERLETRDEEINEAFLDESIAKDPKKLGELTSEQKLVKESLSVLYQKWEMLV